MLDDTRATAASANHEPPEPEALLARIRELEAQVQRLEAEQALHASEARPRLTVVAAEVGIWEHDLAAEHFLMDPRAQQLYALAAVTRTDEFLRRIHPDDLGRLQGEIMAALDPARRANVSTEYRVVHPDGAVRWLRVQGRVEFTANGADARSVRGLGSGEVRRVKAGSCGKRGRWASAGRVARRRRAGQTRRTPSPRPAPRPCPPAKLPRGEGENGRGGTASTNHRIPSM